MSYALWEYEIASDNILIRRYRVQTDKLCCTMEGGQKSSMGNHRHPNVFCGKRAPQLVISTTSISNRRQIFFLRFEFNALLTQFSTSIRVLWHLYWLKLNFQIDFRFVWSTKTENHGTVHFSRILDPIRPFNDCISWLALR